MRIIKCIKNSAIILSLLIIGVILFDRYFPPDTTLADKHSISITDRHGEFLHVFLSPDEQWRLPTETIPKDYQRLLLSYEDRKYFSHHGVDILAIFRAAKQNIQSQRIVSGASTISMQTARLLMPHPRSFRYKFIEMWQAWQLEQRYSKEELLELYTTLIPMGGNIQGIRTAALIYFNQPIEQLSLGQYAFLVALPQSPNRTLRNPVLARNRVLARALSYHSISEQEYQRAIVEPLDIGYFPLPRLAPHYVKQYRAQPYQHQSSLDRTWQHASETLLKNALKTLDAQSNLAALIVDNQSGEYRVYIGSAERSEQRIGYVDYLQAIRSPGSTLKPFITLFAFDRLNYRADTIIADAPLTGRYRPENYDGQYLGNITLSEALIRSRNIPAVSLLATLGADNFDTALKQAGLTLHYPKHGTANLSVALGGVGVRATELAEVYRKLALCSRGKSTLASEQACVATTKILQKVQDQNGTITLGASPIAVKTGTAYGWRDWWVVAYNDDYTWLLWGGSADGNYSQRQASAETLYPIMRQLIALTPNPPRTYVPLATTQIQPLSPYLDKITDTQSLKIVQPIDNSRIQYKEGLAIPLKVTGGQPPYTWMINRQQQLVTSASWQYPLPSSGIYHITVIDQNKESMSIKIRVVSRLTPSSVKLTPLSVKNE